MMTTEVLSTPRRPKITISRGGRDWKKNRPLLDGATSGGAASWVGAISPYAGGGSLVSKRSLCQEDFFIYFHNGNYGYPQPHHQQFFGG